MYNIYLYSGGVYRFDELKESVEDIGGLVLKKEHFHISRGASFLAEELQVIFIVPQQDKDVIKSFTSELKGRLDKLEMEDLEETDLLTYILISDALIRKGSWITPEEIESLIQCPCAAQLCNYQGTETCVLEELNATLEKLCLQNILKSREIEGKTEYSESDQGQAG